MKIKKFLGLLVLISLYSCSDNKEFYAYKSFDNGQWARDSILKVQIDSSFRKTSGEYVLSVELVHNKSYPYKNLWLLVGSNINHTKVMRYDTVKTKLMDNFERWYGTSVGGLHQISIPYKKEKITSNSEPIRFEIKQLMDDNPLSGIEKVGIKIKEES